MNILVVASKFPPEYSGPGVRIPKLYRAIGPELEASVKVLCGGIEYTSPEDYGHEGLPVRRRPARFARRLAFLPARAREFLAYVEETLAGLAALTAYEREGERFDLIHVLGTSGLTAAALWWANRKGIPVLQELVTARARPQQRFLFGHVRPAPGSVVMVMRADAEREAGKPEYGLEVWRRPNPIDTDVFAPPSPALRRDLRRALTPFGEADTVMVSVAKPIPQKNQVFLLDVLAALPGEFKLVLAGPKGKPGPLLERDSRYFEAMLEKARRLGLEARLHVVADYVAAADYMKAGDIYLMPAFDEGFGTPMIEALACGVPVVANAGEPVFAEWIEGLAGGFVRPLEAGLWAQACGEARALPQERRLETADKMARLAGRKNVYADYAALIKKLASGRK